MENIFTQVQQLAEEVKEYVNVRIDLFKLNVAERASGIIANTMATVISAVIFLFFLFLASTGLALFLSAVIGNSYAGFLIVAGIYLILGLIIWFAREAAAGSDYEFDHPSVFFRKREEWKELNP